MPPADSRLCGAWEEPRLERSAHAQRTRPLPGSWDWCRLDKGIPWTGTRAHLATYSPAASERGLSSWLSQSRKSGTPFFFF